MKYEIVGCIPNEWSDIVDGGFRSEEEAEKEIKRIQSGVSGFDWDGFSAKGGSMWTQEEE